MRSETRVRESLEAAQAERRASARKLDTGRVDSDSRRCSRCATAAVDQEAARRRRQCTRPAYRSRYLCGLDNIQSTVTCKAVSNARGPSTPTDELSFSYRQCEDIQRAGLERPLLHHRPLLDVHTLAPPSRMRCSPTIRVDRHPKPLPRRMRRSLSTAAQRSGVTPARDPARCTTQGRTAPAGEVTRNPVRWRGHTYQ